MVARKKYKKNKFNKGDLVHVMNTGLLPSEAFVIDKCPKTNQWQVYTINGNRFWFVGTNLKLIAKGSN